MAQAGVATLDNDYVAQLLNAVNVLTHGIAALEEKVEAKFEDAETSTSSIAEKDEEKEEAPMEVAFTRHDTPHHR